MPTFASRHRSKKNSLRKPELQQLAHYAMIDKSRRLKQIQQMIKKENELMEYNRSKGKGTTIAFDAYPVNLDPIKPKKDHKGRIIDAITLPSLTKKLQTSLKQLQL